MEGFTMQGHSRKWMVGAWPRDESGRQSNFSRPGQERQYWRLLSFKIIYCMDTWFASEKRDRKRHLKCSTQPWQRKTMSSVFYATPES